MSGIVGRQEYLTALMIRYGPDMPLGEAIYRELGGQDYLSLLDKMKEEEQVARDKAHTRYRLTDGTPVPGVTTPLNLLAKPALVPWANRLGLAGIDVNKYVDDKADIGTLAHLLITNHLMGLETDLGDFTPNQVDAAQNSVLSFLEWEKHNPIKETVFVENPLVSEIYRFGGTIDIYCRIGDYLELIDLKTGKGIWPEHEYQISAYFHLMEENRHWVDRVRILNIPRTEDERFEERILKLPDIENGWQIFLHCLAIYNLKKNK